MSYQYLTSRQWLGSNSVSHSPRHVMFPQQSQQANAAGLSSPALGILHSQKRNQSDERSSSQRSTVASCILSSYPNIFTFQDLLKKWDWEVDSSKGCQWKLTGIFVTGDQENKTSVCPAGSSDSGWQQVTHKALHIPHDFHTAPKNHGLHCFQHQGGPDQKWCKALPPCPVLGWLALGYDSLISPTCLCRWGFENPNSRHEFPTHSSRGETTRQKLDGCTPVLQHN